MIVHQRGLLPYTGPGLKSFHSHPRKSCRRHSNDTPVIWKSKNTILSKCCGIERVKVGEVSVTQHHIWPFSAKTHHFKPFRPFLGSEGFPLNPFDTMHVSATCWAKIDPLGTLEAHSSVINGFRSLKPSALDRKFNFRKKSQKFFRLPPPRTPPQGRLTEQSSVNLVRKIRHFFAFYIWSFIWWIRTWL